MFHYYSRYNRDMETNKDTCKTCGRPWGDVQPGCPVVNECGEEYCGCRLGCIRKGEPDCMPKAVIPAVTTETVDGITNLANCFVHVTNINTTFYIDDKHRPMITWAGPVELTTYDYVENPLKLRSQFLFTTINGSESMIYFDKIGTAHIISGEE